MSSPSKHKRVEMTASRSNGKSDVLKPESEAVLGLSVLGAQSMSRLRMAEKRLCDHVQEAQRVGVKRTDDRAVFEAMVQHEEQLGTAAITIVNNVDDVRAPPFDFAYVHEYVADESEIPAVANATQLPKHCTCLGECEPATCGCRLLHPVVDPYTWADPNYLEADFAYTGDGLLHDKILDEPHIPIIECNERCGCRGLCRNRIVGKPRRIPLELTRFAQKGWGLVAGANIKRGRFVIEYTGELITDTTEDTRSRLYDVAHVSYILRLDSYYLQHRLCVPAYLEAHADQAMADQDYEQLAKSASTWFEEQKMDDPILLVDAALFGNVSRFINHSCEPNMVVHPVYTTSRDVRRPYKAMFAKRDIKKGEELTFASHTVEEALEEKEELKRQQYADPAGSKRSSSGDTPVSPYGVCRCGAEKCCGIVFPYESK